MVDNNFNIISLDNNENLLTWLDIEKAEVIETNSKNSCRKIEITYPYDNHMLTEGETEWYTQGNKLLIPAANGLSTCLYVINTEYEIDFWKKNTVTVTAEEVLTEMNYDVLAFESNSNYRVNTAQLTEWFGDYYEISTIDTLSSNRKQVTPQGIMTYMSLLRLIEEQTERVFITEYEWTGEYVKRTLSLRDTSTLRFISKTETLDLNYNLESLEFIKSEENTFCAMAPRLNNNTVDAETVNNSTASNVSTAVINTAENNLSKVGADTTKEFNDVLQDWLDYEVAEGQEVPMIMQKDEEGNLVTTATWNAPFTKEKDSLHIFYDGVTRADYVNVHTYDPEGLKYPKTKMGTVETSETVPEVIYNVLANSLLKKLQPDFELKIDVKDIQLLLGINNLGYSLHETLQVRVPNFNYYVPCTITETKKNLHHAGENSIKVTTDVVSISELNPVEIDSESRVIQYDENNFETGGLLVSDDEGISDAYVTLSIRLEEAYKSGQNPWNTDEAQQTYSEFDPFKNRYVFSDEQISNLEKAIRNDYLDGINRFTEYRLRSVDGKVYSVPWDWAFAIYFARNQAYILNESKYTTGVGSSFGTGYFEDSMTVTHPGGRLDTWTTDQINAVKNPEYLVAIFYEYHYILEDYYRRLQGKTVNDYMHIKLQELYDTYPMMPISSAELQEYSTCAHAALSNATSYLFDYKSEYDVVKQTAKVLSVSVRDAQDGMSVNDFVKIARSYNYNVFPVELTVANLQKYISDNKSVVFLPIQIAWLSNDYFRGVYSGAEDNHMILAYTWVVDSNNQVHIGVLDSNVPQFNPARNWLWEKVFPEQSGSKLIGMTLEDGYVLAGTLIDATYVTYDNSTGKFYNVRSNSDTKYCIVVQQTNANRADVQDVTQLQINPNGFHPELKSYTVEISELESKLCANVISTLHEKYGRTNVTYPIKFKSGSVFNITGDWIRALALEWCRYHNEDSLETNEYSTVTVKPVGNVYNYYRHIDTNTTSIGDYDWFTPYYPKSNSTMYATNIATILFYLGIFRSYNDFVQKSKDYMNMTEMMNIITSTHTGLNVFLVDATMNNISKYLETGTLRDNFMFTVIFTYAKNSTITDTNKVNSTYSPVMLYNIRDSNVDYLNLAGRGNSVTYEYGTKTTEATKNPWNRTSITNMIGWIDTASNEIQDADKNKLLIISWYGNTHWSG